MRAEGRGLRAEEEQWRLASLGKLKPAGLFLFLWVLSAGAWAQAAPDTLVATTVEEAPSEQQSEAADFLQRLHLALRDCDGGRLYGMLPSWERALVPAIAHDAVHGGADQIVGSLSLQQAAVSPYARAATLLRVEHQPQRVDEAGPALVMQTWCVANRKLLQPLYGRLQASDWYWLRTPPYALLSGCLADRQIARDRITLVYQQRQWRFALLETSEGLLLNAFARQPSAKLLQARSEFIARIGQIPAGAQPPDPAACQALTSTPADADLSSYAGLTERLSAVPPCD